MCGGVCSRVITFYVYFISLTLPEPAAATSTDCERPPHVDNASVELVDDDAGDFVSVTYTCAAGYRLHGEAELFCDLGTEEWQGEPPACRAGMCSVQLLARIVL